MKYVQEERISAAALWCRRFALFLIPYFIFIVLLYRFAKVETTQVFVLVAVGLIVSIVALILGLRAIVELWDKGLRGGSMVVSGLFITILVLAPFIYHAILGIQYPLANDISTDPFDAPEYLSADVFRENRIEEGMNPVAPYASEHAQEMLSAYPGLQSRRYPAGTERVLEAVNLIIQDNEWPVTGTQGVPENNRSQDGEAEEPANTEQVLEDNVAEPDDIFIEFLERTPVFGFENDIIVRIASDEESTLVDMRVSSRWGRHDFGYNARFIERFLSELDTSLLGIAGEG